jgi:hypothetical protein
MLQVHNSCKLKLELALWQQGTITSCEHGFALLVDATLTRIVNIYYLRFFSCTF